MHICRTINIDVKYILQFIAYKPSMNILFAKDVEDWFGYDKLHGFVTQVPHV